jgi:hypothetical protein
LGLTTPHFPPSFAKPRSRLLFLLAAGSLVLLMGLVLIDNGWRLRGSSSDERGAVLPHPPAEAGSQSVQEPVVVPNLSTVEHEIRTLLAGQEGEVGVALVGSEGTPLLQLDADERFVLASVSKVYLLVAYLDHRYQEGVKLSDADMDLLQPMIRVSDNNSASAIWRKIGKEDGLAEFLESKDLPQVGQTEEGSWGTLTASAGQVADLLWRLTSGQLLDPESTQVAMSLLEDIHEEQDWGVSAGADDPAARIFLKNGWYPEEDGWRVNSAGTVQAPDEGYVLVVFSYPDETFAEGIALVEEVAKRINGLMSR